MRESLTSAVDARILLAMAARETTYTSGAPAVEELRQQLAERSREQAMLLREVERLRAELVERDEQQHSTAAVLAVLGAPVTDMRQVLERVLSTAKQFCGAEAVFVQRVVSGTHLMVEAVWTRSSGFELPEDVERRAGRRPAPYPHSPTQPFGRALLERRVVHLPDLRAVGPEENYSSDVLASLVSRGITTVLALPLERGEDLVGVLTLYRGAATVQSGGSEPARPFTPTEVGAAEVLAAQVVIALENARLFAELQESNRTLAEQRQQLEEAFGQQKATADILRVITASPTDLQRVLDTICDTVKGLCDTDHAEVWRVEGEVIRRVAVSGSFWNAAFPEAQRNPRLTVTPLRLHRLSTHAVHTRKTVHIHDMASSPEFPHARGMPMRTALATPLLREGLAIGTITLRRLEVRPFSDQQIKLLESFADQAVIAIENARLFSEFQESNKTLKDALEQQTATAEVLRIVARSPADVGAVLGTIVERLTVLCDAARGGIWYFHGEWIIHEKFSREDGSRSSSRSGRPERSRMKGDYPIGRAYLSGEMVHVPDVTAVNAADGYYPNVVEERLAQGVHSILALPLRREGETIGVLNLTRGQARAFTNSQIALAQTFADQAVVAIENARLFGELRERDERRHQELERASAIQSRLLPETVEGWPGVLEIAVRFRPAVETSGDFYDVLALTPTRPGEPPPLQIAVGDVAGKGMAAALVTALARSALHATASVPTRMAVPAATLREAGARLHRDVGSNHFVACALAVVEPPGMHHSGPLLRLSNAAQVPVLLCRGGTVQEIAPPGYKLPLGVQPDGAYRDAEVELQPADVVIFASDGLPEAPARGGGALSTGSPIAPPTHARELFGFERLARCATHWSQQAQSAEAIAEAIWRDLTAWCGEESHHDDMTLLVLRRPTAT